MNSVQIRSFFLSVFSRIDTEYEEKAHSVRMGENTDQKKLHIWTLFSQCLNKPLQYLLINLLSANPKRSIVYRTLKHYCQHFCMSYLFYEDIVVYN